MSAKYTTDEILDRLETLIECADAVAESWESGDLADAVTTLGGAADEARDLLENMRPAQEDSDGDE